MSVLQGHGNKMRLGPLTEVNIVWLPLILIC